MNEQCPICSGPLATCPGTKLNPTDGITVYCPNHDCGMADWGHGKNEADALEVFKAKCGKGGK